MIRISSHLNIFKLKSEPLWKKNTWSVFRGENKGKMNGSNFEPSQNHMHMLACVMVSFDDFLSHLTILPALTTV